MLLVGSSHTSEPASITFPSTDVAALICASSRSNEDIRIIRLTSKYWYRAATLAVQRLLARHGELPSKVWALFPSAYRLLILLDEIDAWDIGDRLQRLAPLVAALPARVTDITLSFSPELQACRASGGYATFMEDFTPFITSLSSSSSSSCAAGLTALHLLHKPHPSSSGDIGSFNTQQYGISAQAADLLLRQLPSLQQLTMAVHGGSSPNTNSLWSFRASSAAAAGPTSLAHFPSGLQSLKLATSMPLAPAALAGCTQLTQLQLHALWQPTRQQQAGTAAGPLLSLQLPGSLRELLLHTAALSIDVAAAAPAAQQLTRLSLATASGKIGLALLAASSIGQLTRLQEMELHVQLSSRDPELADAAAQLSQLSRLRSFATKTVACGFQLWQQLASLPNLQQLKCDRLLIGMLDAAPLRITHLAATALETPLVTLQPGGLVPLLPELRHASFRKVYLRPNRSPCYGLSGHPSLQHLESGAWGTSLGGLQCSSLPQLQHVGMMLPSSDCLQALQQLSSCSRLQELQLELFQPSRSPCEVVRHGGLRVLLDAPCSGSLRRVQILCCLWEPVAVPFPLVFTMAQVAALLAGGLPLLRELATDVELVVTGQEAQDGWRVAAAVQRELQRESVQGLAGFQVVREPDGLVEGRLPVWTEVVGRTGRVELRLRVVLQPVRAAV